MAARMRAAGFDLEYMDSRMNSFRLLAAVLCLSQLVQAKNIKVHGYVTAVHSQTSFDIDDFRIMRDESLTIDFDRDEDLDNSSDYPREIRVGAEIEIRGDFDEQSRELTAKSVKVYTRESKTLKRTALITEIPALTRKAQYWEGTLRLDGQHLVVDEATQVSFVPNDTQRRAAKETAKRAKRVTDKSLGADDVAEQPLTQLSDVHVNMSAAYEGVRLADGRVRLKKIQFKDNELTTSEARLWKSLTPSVKGFRDSKPGELRLGKGGKFKTTPSEEVQEYVRALGKRLIPASQKILPAGDPNKIPFQFHVAEEKYVNAFATANGVVVVTAPMLAMAENEAQLAGVLGHEIAHATQEHTLRQMEFHKKKRMALAIGAAFASAYGAYNVADLLTLTQAAIANGYQRYLENQADRIGMEYMMSAGYDPRETARFWKTMSLKGGGDSRTDFFWSNHDNNATRRSYLMSELAINYKGVDFDALKRNSESFDQARTVLRELYRKNKRIKVKF